MGVQECKMFLASVAEQIGKYPIAEVITIAPTQEEAEKHAREELESLFPELSKLLVYGRGLGSIFCAPLTTTVFLYTQRAGRIK